MADEKERNIRKDEEQNEDVEAHSYGAPRKAAPKLGREDEGDDVEAHVHKMAPKINAPKIN